MDLKERARLEAAGPQPLIEPDHRDLDDVRRGPLDRHVDGHPLPGGAQRRVASREFRDVPLSSEERRHVALTPGLLLDLDHVVADTGVRGEVGVDELLGLGARDVGAAGQAEIAQAVGDPEVDHLGHGAFSDRHVGRVLVEHAGGCLAMQIRPPSERVAQVLVARHVGQDPQLDLAVVGGDQGQVRRPGHEGAADPPTERRPDRDVLKVWVGRRETTGRRDRLVERRVQSTIVGQQRRQRFDVRRAQLGVRPPLEQLVDHRMGRPQVFQYGGIGREAGLRPLAFRQVQLEEEDLLELLRAAEVELVSDIDVDLCLKARDLGPKLSRQKL